MADAHANLTMCVNSIVHGVNDSEKYLAISKMVQSATTDDNAILAPSQLRIINIISFWIPRVYGWTYTYSMMGALPALSRA